jgi:hypothetical protein
MGYTHYFIQKHDAPLEQWAALLNDLRKVYDQRPAHSDSAGAYCLDQPMTICDGDGTTLITDAEQLDGYVEADIGSCICFNGDDRDDQGMAHETFYLARECEEDNDFQFCKTARKPYDWLVVAALLLAEKHCPGCWEISSDGSEEDWAPVVTWLDAHGFGPMTLPANIRNEED